MACAGSSHPGGGFLRGLFSARQRRSWEGNYSGTGLGMWVAAEVKVFMRAGSGLLAKIIFTCSFRAIFLIQVVGLYFVLARQEKMLVIWKEAAMETQKGKERGRKWKAMKEFNNHRNSKYYCSCGEPSKTAYSNISEHKPPPASILQIKLPQLKKQ